MKIPRHKSSVEKQEIGQDVRPCEPERFTRVMARNLTMLDIIGLGLLTTFQCVLFQCTPTGSGNPKEKDDSE